MLIDLNYPAPVAVELPAEQALLLVIDMENENVHPDGALFIGEPVRKIIPKIARLREEVRRAGGRIVHTQSVHSPDALEFTVFKNTARKLEGGWGAALIDELNPAAGEPLIVKRTHDCFYQTELDSLFEMDGTAHRDEKEVLQAFSLFTSFGYKHNVTMTRSDLIQFRHAV
jgi:nicotinamidase-related amidase